MWLSSIWSDLHASDRLHRTYTQEKDIWQQEKREIGEKQEDSWKEGTFVSFMDILHEHLVTL